MLLRIALYNLIRKPWRSLAAVLVLAFGVTGNVFLWGINTGANENMRNNVIGLISGHIQVSRKGFLDSLSPRASVEQSERLLGELRTDPRVQALSARVVTPALLGNDQVSTAIVTVGVDPVEDVKVSGVHRFMTEGRYLSADDSKAVILGDRLARKIGASVGDSFVLMVKDAYGVASGESVQLVGVFHAGLRPLDAETVFAPRSMMQSLLEIESEVSTLNIRLNERDTLEDVIRSYSGRDGANEYQSWSELYPQVEQWIAWGVSVQWILSGILIGVVSLSILGVMLVTLAERTKEIGVLLAVGTLPSRIFSIIVLEGLLLQLFGFALGLLAGRGLLSGASQKGIPMYELADALQTNFMSPVLFPEFNFVKSVECIALLLIMTTGALAFPAVRACRKEPAAAIYHSGGS